MWAGGGQVAIAIGQWPGDMLCSWILSNAHDRVVAKSRTPFADRVVAKSCTPFAIGDSPATCLVRRSWLVTVGRHA